MLKVDTQVLDTAVSTLESLSSQLETISSKLYGSVTARAEWLLIQGNNTFQNKLKACSKNVSMLSTSAHAMKESLASVSSLYSATERQNANIHSDNDTSGKSTPTVDWLKTGLKLVGSFGLGGTIIGNALQVITGGHPIKDSLSGTAKIVESAAKYVSENGFKWNAKDFFGFTPKITKETSTNFFTNLGDEFKKYTKTGNTAQNVATAAKWAGTIISIGSIAYDNFTDEENTTIGRKLAETVGESAVTIGESAVVSAAVTTAFAAVGAVGAPAVAVGAAAVAVTFLIDTGVEHLTGKKPAELISDWVLDDVVPAVGNAVQVVGDVAKSAGEAIADGFSKASNAVANWWESTKRSLFAW